MALHSFVPRPHLARVLLAAPRAILKAIRTGVGFGSGTETRLCMTLDFLLSVMESSYSEIKIIFFDCTYTWGKIC